MKWSIYSAKKKSPGSGERPHGGQESKYFPSEHQSTFRLKGWAMQTVPRLVDREYGNSRGSWMGGGYRLHYHPLMALKWENGEIWEQCCCWPVCLISVCPLRKESSTESDCRPHTTFKSSECIRPTGPGSEGPMPLYHHHLLVTICWWKPALVRYVHAHTALREARTWDSMAPRYLPWARPFKDLQTVPYFQDNPQTLQRNPPSRLWRKLLYTLLLCSKFEKWGFSKFQKARLQSELWHTWPVSYQGIACKELMLKGPP